MTLIILICHLAGPCDRIAQPVPNCIMSGMLAQSMLAQTALLQPGDHVTIKCGN